MANQSYNRYGPRLTVGEQILLNGVTTIGENGMSWMGLKKGSSGSFGYSLKNSYREITGHVKVTDIQAFTNSSSFEDSRSKEMQVRNYGALAGVAQMNNSAQGTTSSSLKVIALPDRKQDNAQRTSVRESFAEFCKVYDGKLEELELTVDAAHFYQQTNLVDGMVHTIGILEITGVAGRDSEGSPVFWSILDYPRASKEEPASDEAPARAPRTRRSDTQAEAPMAEAGVE